MHDIRSDIFQDLSDLRKGRGVFQRAEFTGERGNGDKSEIGQGALDRFGSRVVAEEQIDLVALFELARTGQQSIFLRSCAQQSGQNMNNSHSGSFLPVDAGLRRNGCGPVVMTRAPGLV